MRKCSRFVIAGAVVAGCALFSGSPALGRQGDAPEKTVLVMALEAIGLDAKIAVEATARIAEEISRHRGIEVSTVQDLKDILSLEKTKELMGCKEDVSCMSRISRMAKTDLTVSGSVGKIGDAVVVNLSLIDTGQTAIVGRASETVDSVEAVPGCLPGVVGRLFGWSEEARAPRFKLSKGEKMSFAVFDLKPFGVSKETARNLTQILSVEIKRVEGSSVVGRDDIIAMLQLEEQKRLFGCEENTACLAEVGGALGVDKMVVGNVGKLVDSYVVSLRLIDPRQARVDNRVAESFRGEEQQLIRSVRHAARRLLGIEADQVGSIAASATEEESEVYVDGKLVGKLPMPPVESIAPGRHSIRMVKEGFFDWQSEIYVEPSETTAVWAKLSERPEKWYQKWWVWTVAGAVVVGVVTTAVVLSVGSDTPPPYGDINPGNANVNVNASRGLLTW